MKIPSILNSLLTALYLRRKGVKWSGKLPYIDMRRPPEFDIAKTGSLVLGSGVKIFTRLGRTLFQVMDGASVTIGDESVLNGVHWIHAEKEITIGPYALIAEGVRIIDSNMHPICPGDDQPPRPVRLGRNCWICLGSSICPGVEVGTHSVVSLHSVVKKNVPAKTIVGGDPAVWLGNIECPDDWRRP